MLKHERFRTAARKGYSPVRRLIPGTRLDIESHERIEIDTFLSLTV